jgi:hypothetical protein
MGRWEQQEIAGATAVAGSRFAPRGFDTTYRCHRLEALRLRGPCWSDRCPLPTALVNANANNNQSFGSIDHEHLAC